MIKNIILFILFCLFFLNATIPEEKDPIEITMDDALILIEKRKEYDKNKKSRKRKK